MAQKFLSDIHPTAGLKDSSGDLGASGQVLSSTGSGTNWVQAGSGATVIHDDQFTATANQTAFTLSNTVDAENKTQVYIDGAYQAKAGYTVSGTTLTFDTGLDVGSKVEVITFATAIASNATAVIKLDEFVPGDAISGTSGQNFTLSQTVSDEKVTQVYINGVYQHKDTYSISGTTLQFSSAPPSGSDIEVITFDTVVAADGTLSATTFLGDLNGTINTSTTATTQSAGNNSTKISTTAYTDAKVADAINNGTTAIAPSQNAVFDALALKANLAGPTFTGTPAAPTASAGTNTTQLATTAFVTTGISNIVDSAPGTLNTLNELAAALGDDVNFSTTVTNSIATKLPLAGGTLTGKLSVSQSGADMIDLTRSSVGTYRLAISGSDAFSVFDVGANADRFVISSSGNVGIGLSPSTVWSTSYNALQIGLGGSIYAHKSAGSAMRIAANVVYEGTAPNYYDKYLTTSTASKYEQDSGNHIWSTAASGTINTNISWSERLRVSSDGNVGIGISSPRAILDLKNTGDGVLNTTASNYQILLEAPQGTGDYGRNIGWAIGSGSVNAAINAVDGGASNATDLSFSTGAENTMAERLRIKSNGNVGIATDDPKVKLHITDPNQNGSITDTIPSWWGQVIERSYSSGASSAALGLIGGTLANGAGGYLYLGFSDDVDNNYIGIDGNSMKFGVAGSTRLTISSGGTVSIPLGTRPTTGKGGALIVGGNADGTGLTTNTRKLGLITCPSFNNSNGNMAMVTGDTSSSTVAKLAFGSINTGYASPTQISFHTTSTVGTIGTEKLRIASTGNVGIGVTPSAWYSGWKAIEGLPSFAIASKGLGMYVAENCYLDAATDWIYSTNAAAAHYQQYGDAHRWYSAPSGTAGNTIPFVNVMSIKTGGNVGIGTDSPSAKLHVVGKGLFTDDIQLNQTNPRIDYGNSTAGALRFWSVDENSEKMRLTSAGNLLLGITNESSEPINKNFFIADFQSGASITVGGHSGYHTAVRFRHNGATTPGSIVINHNSTTYNTSSDYRIKENVTPITDALSRLNQLKPSRFNFIGYADNTVDGFIAHEVQDIIPEAICGEKDAVNEDGTPNYQGIDQSKIVPLLTAAIQEQQTIIEDLKARIETLEG